jgi:hypothetical protein
MTDDTARAILELADGEPFEPSWSEMLDVQAMARLWLLKDDLRDAVAECLNEAQSASYQRPKRVDYYVDLLSQVEGLGK